MSTPSYDPTTGVTTSDDPAVIRAQIDATRARMSEDVNALTDYAAPSNVAHRQADKVKGAVSSAVGGVKDRVMGSAHHTGGAASSAASSVGDAVQGAPAAVQQKTQGNPLAAGLIALGAGWLIGSLLPASSKEAQAAAAVKERASTVTEPLAHAAQEVAGNLKEPAAQAAQSVKETAADAAATVKDEGADAARSTQQRTADAKDAVQSSRS
jgi:gas vesicle protein